MSFYAVYCTFSDGDDVLHSVILVLRDEDIILYQIYEKHIFWFFF